MLDSFLVAAKTDRSRSSPTSYSDEAFCTRKIRVQMMLSALSPLIALELNANRLIREGRD